ncbi:MAG TPA: hypothetical protein VGF23_14520 [Gaiellaceae bacterium]
MSTPPQPQGGRRAALLVAHCSAALDDPERPSARRRLLVQLGPEFTRTLVSALRAHPRS